MYIMSHLKQKKKTLLTLLSIFQPFYKLLHLLQEDTLSFGHMGICIPLQNNLLAQNISYRQSKQEKKASKHRYNLCIPLAK